MSREDIVIRVSIAVKLLDLRVKLIEIVNAAPSDQHIIFNGAEVTDNSKTLYQLGIRPESRLFVWVDAPNLEVLAETSKRSTNNLANGGNSNSPCVGDAKSGRLFL